MTFAHVFAAYCPETGLFHKLPGEYVDAAIAEELEKKLARAEEQNASFTNRIKELVGEREGAHQYTRRLEDQFLAKTDELVAAKKRTASLEGERNASDHMKLVAEAHMRSARSEVETTAKQRDAALDAEKRALAIVDRQANEIADLTAFPMHFHFSQPRQVHIKVNDSDSVVTAFLNPASVTVVQ